VPAGTAGLLPAFWMKHNDDKWPPELDILEVFGTTGAPLYGALRPPGPTTRSSGAKWDGGDLSTAFHTFGVEWDANSGEVVRGRHRAPHLRPAGSR
jgi:beta-glucanase (GH16 family)